MTETATARVPAWKRLGLKLKYAQETPAQSTATTPATATPTATSQPPAKVATTKLPKRDREDTFVPEAPAKRVKSQPYERVVQAKPAPPPPEPYVPKRYGFAGISAEPTGKRIVFDDEDTAPLTAAAPINTEEPAEKLDKRGRPAVLRKSVSFTPDTKQKDGETGQKYFKAWASGEDPTAIDPSAEEPESPSKQPTPQSETKAKEPKQKKAKKPKKSKSTTIDSKSSAAAAPAVTELTGEPPAYVAYLEQHHSDKGHWKFNKKKQNDLLKNLFNIDKLPANHDAAIISYVNGLQGVARERLALQAEEILKGIYDKELEENDDGDAMSLDTPESRKAAYFAALMRYIDRVEALGAERNEYSDDQLRIIRQETQAGRRAHDVLEQGLMMQLYPERVAAAVPESAAEIQPNAAVEKQPNRIEKKGRKSKRKARTNAPSSDESSSDDSSSDEDSTTKSTSDDSESGSEKETGKFFPDDLLDKRFGTKPAARRRS